MSAVLVVGGTGHVGQWVVRELLQRNCNVILAARDVGKANALFGTHEDLKVVQVRDATHPGAFANDSLWEGVQIVVCCLGSAPGQSAQSILQGAMLGLLVGAKRRQIKRWLHISSSLVTRPWHPMTLLLNSVAGWVMHYHYTFEGQVRQSGIPYTILRPMRLLEKPEFQEFPQPGLLLSQGDKPKGREVSVRLVGMVAVEALFGSHQSATINRTFELATNKKATLSSTWPTALTHLEPDAPLPVVSHATAMWSMRFALLTIVGSLAYLGYQSFKK